MIYLIGVGAAGNKAAIKALELEVVDESHMTLINSTEKDIPNDYKEHAIIIGDNLKGCGKERKIARNAIKNYLQVNNIFKIPEDVDRVVIVTSVEGGTGSGSTPLLAKYIRDSLKKNTSIFAFTGFETDSRGLKNTIEFMKELDSRTTIQILSNKKFLEEANNNYIKAQELANIEFCKRILIMSGTILEDTDQNIDDTDLHKLVDAFGLMDITYMDIDGPLKNIETFDKICSKMVDESKSIDFTPTASRLGVVFNGKVLNNDSIDYGYRIFKSKYGEPFEVYTHLQENTSYKKEFLACIASGMKLPIDEIQRIYDEYMERTSKISKDKDSFFELINLFEESEEDDIFDMQLKPDDKISKEDFFRDL